ncbi:hypothetical protein C8J57DRAFT_998699, partial [Mycena rebaudengoi]
PNATPSIVRQVANNLPVTDVSSPDIICGPGAQSASEIATVGAGEFLAIYWTGYQSDGGGNWIHEVGPMLMTYLSMCGKSCNEFSPDINTRWFKISQQKKGLPAKVLISPQLKAGLYLLRHEIIALHAEFFANCLQINVTGNGDGVPSAKEVTFFPGAYKTSDPGI